MTSNRPVTTDDIRIRTELRPGDLGYVTHLHGKWYQREYGYGISFEAYVAKGLYDFYQDYKKGKSGVWLCEHEEQMIGCLFLQQRGDEAQLRYFLIEPEYRSIGLGKKLMSLFMQFMKDYGYRRAFLLTTHELFTASHLYVSNGFRITEQFESDAFGKALTEQRYELKID